MDLNILEWTVLCWKLLNTTQEINQSGYEPLNLENVSFYK